MRADFVTCAVCTDSA